ncbi:helicase-exonuclease AddAB subunit AddA [Alkalihalobacillus hwajinpoensis]|uniref:helicase-exonuclease AddAB subunit AddA n=1 Tax=Guptibacillus hwajinpoensis TaxID=208199 RepID=UPI001883DD38|nr:helicase-exonuclease AddAB subunit AddA [Pseudalkalibacillus hwajinpoensis]MBF0708126.1 helicase-exonuclease AddAB subunit AddA [Pseudalkalibacillus hwajinpoensis]
MTIMNKPEGSKWTDEQWEAIAARDQDVLVAAAAGSGKTAVLVERIIRRLADENDPAEVDRILVVTFTNAAAAEMRHRIGEALEEKLKEDPSSLYLRRQLSMLNRASISTLHSFCMEVLRRYYYEIDLDPAFRVADQTEAALLREEAMEELFEEHYSKKENEAFYDLVDRYSSDRSDVDLQLLVERLYHFSSSHPWPEQWLQDSVAVYEEASEKAFDELVWVEEIKKDVVLQLEGMREMQEKAISLSNAPGGPEPYLEMLEMEREMTERLLTASAQTWQELKNEFEQITFGRLKPCKGDQYDSEMIDTVKGLRDRVKKTIQSLKEELFQRNPEEYVEDIVQLAPVLGTLSSLVNEFRHKYTELKKEKGLVDYSDLEHYCLSILLDDRSTPENPVPSSAAREYQTQFAEVLIDEYQDTNSVQETILNAISRTSDSGGNRFMVGDVKQSIYRFRLAEPGLFLSKYKTFGRSSDEPSKRIDLARNFRSREEVLNSTNFIFKQIMDERVGEIEYDEAAELIPGAEYPKSETVVPEVHIIDKSAQKEVDEEETEKVQLEARLIASNIKDMMGKSESERTKVYDRKEDRMRPIQYRDMVILMRATASWAPVIMEELKQAGIPSYSDLATGYFEATEVAIMMSLLNVIDNPYQDIPLASVLRSPIIGLTEEELSLIRINEKHSSYYLALRSYCETESNKLSETLSKFITNLNRWREAARQSSLSELIWQLYRETNYYEFVGGMPAGLQRQANLRALYDRARQYEATSFRGLFRFLRFIDRMKERGSDLGTARALGEQEDVVRVMTIHKSKGLEFPVVFIAGIAKQFNMRDMANQMLMHKEFGLATKFIDPIQRISYPTLPYFTLQKRMKLELLAEEMRVLYVALTRAKEKLILVGTVNDWEKERLSWAGAAGDEWLLSDYERSKGKTYLSWIGPAIMRHKDLASITEGMANFSKHDEVFQHPARWSLTLHNASSFAEIEAEDVHKHREYEMLLQKKEPIPEVSSYKDEVNHRLDWTYPHQAASETRSKQSVTEVKRQREIFQDERSDDKLVKGFSQSLKERPRFLQSKQLTPAERGTAMHIVMQHLDLQKWHDRDDINELVAKLEQKELLTTEQGRAIDVEQIHQLMDSELGQKMRNAAEIYKEVPFSLGVDSKWIYPEFEGDQETVVLQGVIDCILRDQNGELVLVDYKTDVIANRFTSDEQAMETMKRRYTTQLHLYEKAINEIWKVPCKEKILFFFDGGRSLLID